MISGLSHRTTDCSLLTFIDLLIVAALCDGTPALVRTDNIIPYNKYDHISAILSPLAYRQAG